MLEEKRWKPSGWFVFGVICLLLAAIISFSGCGIRVAKDSPVLSADVLRGMKQGRTDHLGVVDQVVEAKIKLTDIWVMEWFEKKLPSIAEKQDVVGQWESYEDREKFTKFILDAAEGFAWKRNEKIKLIEKAERKEKGKIRRYWDHYLQVMGVLHSNLMAVSDLQGMVDKGLKKLGAPEAVMDPAGAMEKELKNLFPEVK